MRSDPFWEFGSFGITGCHGKNLMNLRNAKSLTGVRLAFVQGGNRGARLVYLTAPVKIVKHRHHIEALWAPKLMPFKYECGPLIVSNTGATDFPHIKAAITGGRRTSLEGQFSSNFRSRAMCLNESTARELISVYNRIRETAPPEAIASCYAEALPWAPPKVDRQREQTYSRLLQEAREVASANRSCQRKRAPGPLSEQKTKGCKLR
jgi:hypothetical protein